MIICKSQKEMTKIREACQIVARLLKELRPLVRPGVTTKELDRFAEDFIQRAGARPAFKGYRGYPATLCTSVNEAVVHGIPNDYKLREGDIVGVDAGAIVDSYYGDAAVTFPVGTIVPEVERLLQVTRESLELGIQQVRVGNRVSDIGHRIQKYVQSFGYSVVRDFVGHGIGQALHEDPQVPNFGEPGRGPRLREGMVLAIEPMVNMKGPEVRILSDRWTAVTADGSYSAHFEHTVACTSNGPEVLTRLDHGA
ncbi:MAG: type I methionyl aminopeptidase [Acidobacteria bacterium]|nr:type I methionyl aminopeptidase [Acidobacteriota bacterium]